MSWPLGQISAPIGVLFNNQVRDNTHTEQVPNLLRKRMTWFINGIVIYVILLIVGFVIHAYLPFPEHSTATNLEAISVAVHSVEFHNRAVVVKYPLLLRLYGNEKSPAGDSRWSNIRSSMVQNAVFGPLLAAQYASIRLLSY